MRNGIGSVIPKRFAIVHAVAVFIVLTNGVLTNSRVRAGDDCLGAPNMDPPHGSHWYYRLDGVRQRHCWFLGAEGRKARVEPEVQSIAKSAPPTRTETAADRLTSLAQADPPLPPRRPAIAPSTRAQASVEGIAQGAPPATFAIAPRPDRERTDYGSDRKAGATSTFPDIDANEELTRPAAAGVANARAVTLTRVALLVLSTLALAGIIQYAAFRSAVNRQRPIHVERRRADRSVSIAPERLPPAFAAPHWHSFGRRPVEQIDSQDIEAGIRQILDTMKRQAA